MPGVFEMALRVEADSIDTNGHVNNVVYVSWMQDLATAHSAAQGWSDARYQQFGVAWVARKHQIEYLRPAFPGDELLLRSWVVDMQRYRSRRRYRFERPTDGCLLAEAETEWIFIDRQSGRPRSVIPEVSNSFILVGEEPSTEPGERLLRGNDAG